MISQNIALCKENATCSKRSLETVMDEIGKNAQARGLTPEILDSILNGEQNSLRPDTLE